MTAATVQSRIRRILSIGIARLGLVALEVRLHAPRAEFVGTHAVEKAYQPRYYAEEYLIDVDGCPERLEAVATPHQAAAPIVTRRLTLERLDAGMLAWLVAEADAGRVRLVGPTIQAHFPDGAAPARVRAILAKWATRYEAA